jgi:hypothetical protein
MDGWRKEGLATKKADAQDRETEGKENGRSQEAKQNLTSLCLS